MSDFLYLSGLSDSAFIQRLEQVNSSSLSEQAETELGIELVRRLAAHNPTERAQLILSLTSRISIDDYAEEADTIIRMLSTLDIDVGVINAIDSNGQTALHRACYMGNLAGVGVLLAAGARMDIRDRSGMLPNQLGQRVVEINALFAAESSRRASAPRPVAIAAPAPFASGLDLSAQIAREAARRSLDVVDGNGQTALHKACYNGNLEEVRRLLTNGASMDIRDHSNMLPNQLGPCVAEINAIFAEETRRRAAPRPMTTFYDYHSSVTGAGGVASTFSISGNLDEVDSNGQTALHRACYRGDMVEVRHLLEAGVRRDIRDHQGMLPNQLGSRVAEVNTIFAQVDSSFIGVLHRMLQP